MTTELARIDDQTAAATSAPFSQAPLAVQMDYARAVSTAALLPQAYRNKPADIMLAVGLGSSMGLSPAESLYRIDVIQGKPTASAELIAANVRKAGHRLRVMVDAEPSATATIIRADDPDFEFTVTRDAEWARAMGLSSKDNYKKQPATMLQWRAITAVARLACPEALYGVSYTPDEMYDVEERPGRSGGLAAALSTTTAEQIHEPEPEVVEPETVEPTAEELAAQVVAALKDATTEAEVREWGNRANARNLLDVQVEAETVRNHVTYRLAEIAAEPDKAAS